MGNLRIYLTGRPAIETGDGLFEDLSDRLTRLALAYLVMHRHRPVSLAEIADAGWRTDRPANWEKRVKGALAMLESTLAMVNAPEIVLEQGHDLVRMHLPSNVWVDLEHAHRSLEEAGVALIADDLDRALTMSTAASIIGNRPFLPAIDSVWVNSMRTRLESAFIDGLILRTEVA
ncbi:MAG: AfsR/SARP family transcriptional regulator, partial [Gemmatimonadota bacterium]